ncbi:hypothetical protein [Streptomyces poriferorum]|uniref:Cytochrome P450 n=1 Tax=Streptomyces poriferorum TaxID=2798799 RepID=A0ABY9IL57_9ACTN|nr:MULTISPECIES: hypothetical protein [unclassified Streptomyces]MDP5315557.1 hypothetical protein [Streptomyces sp. Alt4]WLQ55594.1 hypothetical protein P8A19_09130 [Streptomyces sp. Alt2]
MNAVPAPVAALLDAWDDSSLYPAALRAGLLPYLGTRGPCVAVRTLDGGRAWAVTGHRALREAALRPRDFSGELLGTAMSDPSPEEIALLRLQLPGLSCGPHARMRHGLSAPLRADMARGLSDRVREATAARTAALSRPAAGAAPTALLSRTAAGAGPQPAAADLVRDVVVPVVADALGELLGVPRGLAEEFRSWCVDSSEMASDPEAEEQALRAFLQLCTRLRRHRTAHPADDLPTSLATRLTSSTGGFALNWVLLVKAGFGATVSAGAQLLRALPGGGAAGGGAAGGVHALLDETLRRHPPILQARRTAARHTSLAGRDIAAGERVLLVFAAPGQASGRVPHTVFGHGRHACPGAPWARALLTGLADGAAPAAARWHLPDTASTYATSFSQGLRTLPVEPVSRGPCGAGSSSPSPTGHHAAPRCPADPRSAR